MQLPVREIRLMETPCVNVCVINDETGMCEGCNRRLDEIAAWSRLTPAERRRIMAELPARKPPARNANAGA